MDAPTHRDDAPELSPRTVFLAGFFVELALVPAAALIGYWLVETPFPFRLAFTPEGLLWGLGATVPMVFLALALTSPAGRRFRPLRGIYERVRDLLGGAIRDMSVEDMILLAAAAGIGEEVLFRGTIQTVLGTWGLIGASLLFGVLHALTPAYFVLATLMGLYLGWVFQASENLLAPILVHWIYDSVALYLLRREIKKEAANRPEEEVSRS